jgi:transcriptional regulator with XRE-family HTH domain
MAAFALNIKSLRLRLGWTQSDLARRLNCESTEVQKWETGQSTPNSEVSGRLELLVSHAETNAQELQSVPKAENFCERRRLGQIDIYCVEDSDSDKEGN